MTEHETDLLAAARRGDYAEVVTYSGIDVKTMDEILVRAAFNGHVKLVEWCLAKYTPRKEASDRAWLHAQLRGFSHIMVMLL